MLYSCDLPGPYPPTPRPPFYHCSIEGIVALRPVLCLVMRWCVRTSRQRDVSGSCDFFPFIRCFVERNAWCNFVSVQSPVQIRHDLAGELCSSGFLWPWWYWWGRTAL